MSFLQPRLSLVDFSPTKAVIGRFSQSSAIIGSVKRLLLLVVSLAKTVLVVHCEKTLNKVTVSPDLFTSGL